VKQMIWTKTSIIRKCEDLKLTNIFVSIKSKQKPFLQRLNT